MSVLDRAAAFPILGGLLALGEIAAVLAGARVELLPGGIVLALAVAVLRILPTVAGPIAVLGVCAGGAVTVLDGGVRLDGILVATILAWGCARYGGRLTRALGLAGVLVGAVVVPALAQSYVASMLQQTVVPLQIGVFLGGVVLLAGLYTLLWWRGRRSRRAAPPAPLNPPGAVPLDDLAVAIDSGIAILYLVVVGIVFVGDGSATVIVIAVLTVACAVRRRAPALALGIAWLGAISQMTLGLEPSLADLAILLVLFSVGAYGDRRARILGAVSAVVGAIVASVYTGFLRSSVVDFAGALLASGYLFGAAIAVLGLSWTGGILARTLRIAQDGREAQRRAEEERTAAQLDLDAEAERNAIARDMHDVVAHSLAVVIAQADGARYLGTAHPEQTDEALATISAVARDALGDVRQLLAQLRHSEASGPQPDASEIPALLDAVAASGAGVQRDFDIDLASVPRGAGLALFRITQEATTNALRHGAPGTSIRVSLRQQGEEIVLTVRNRAEPGALGPSGHGLVGMRERALIAGGSLRAEPDGSDFLVEARLPRIRQQGDTA